MGEIGISLAGKILAIVLAFGVVVLLAAWPLINRRLSATLRSAFGRGEVKPATNEREAMGGKVLPAEKRFKKAA